MEESYAVLGGLGYVQLDTLLSNLAYRARAPELTLPLPPLARLPLAFDDAAARAHR